ncbi:MAG: NPCBM/NEW2 domain-containing protein [Pirellulales bacterium]
MSPSLAIWRTPFPRLALSVTVLLLAGGGQGPPRAFAAVAVVSNRTAGDVHFTIAAPGEKPRQFILKPGELAPIPVTGAVQAVFNSGKSERQYLLDPNSVYYFGTLDAGLVLQEIEFPLERPEGGEPESPPKKDQPTRREPVPPKSQRGGGDALGVKILVDDSERATRQVWEPQLRRQVASASEVLKRHGGLGLEVVGVGTWQSDKSIKDYPQAAREFAQKAQLENARLAIGFTDRYRMPRGTVVPAEEPAPLQTHLLVRDWADGTTEAERVEILVHQLGHVLGAVHSPEPESVMRPSIGDRKVRRQGFAIRFDAVNTLALNLVAEEIRSRDLHEWKDLPPATLARWTSVTGEIGRAMPQAQPRVRRQRPPGQPAAEPQFTVGLSDGTQRAEGRRGAEHTRKLDDLAVLDPASPVRWLRNEALAPAVPPQACVEFFGGDVLPGEVVAYRDGDPAGLLAAIEKKATEKDAAKTGTGEESLDQVLTPCLVVQSPLGVNVSDDSPDAPILVKIPWVRRIIWQRRASDRYEPGTAYCRDGREVRFRSVRFGPTAARFLAEEGITEIAFDRLAELHLPRIDPWEAYFDQLAVLAPGGTSRLVRIETDQGLRVTASGERFQAYPHGAYLDASKWFHVAQPAWSLQALRLSDPRVRLWLYSLPHEVPLSTIEVSAWARRSALGGGWHWQVDRNVQGGPLHSGEDSFGWGFGVQAFTSLEFPLPDCSRAFRGRFGLDDAVGAGGCVQAKVLAGAEEPPARSRLLPGQSRPGTAAKENKVLFQSPAVVGSGLVHDTGWLDLPPRPNGRRRLILIADAAAAGSPTGADPLDLGDAFDWLEPRLELDSALLRAEIHRRLPRAIPAWDEWTVTSGAGSLTLLNRWESKGGKVRGCHVEAGSGEEPLVLSRQAAVSSPESALLVWVSRQPRGTTRAMIEVRVDGQTIRAFDVPMHTPAKEALPVLIPLGAYRGRKIHLELVQRPKTDESLVQWLAATVVE